MFALCSKEGWVQRGKILFSEIGDPNILNIISPFFFSSWVLLKFNVKNLQGILFVFCYNMERVCKVQTERENPCLTLQTQIELKYTLTCTLQYIMTSKVLKILSLKCWLFPVEGLSLHQFSSWINILIPNRNVVFKWHSQASQFTTLWWICQSYLRARFTIKEWLGLEGIFKKQLVQNN